jgi:hypothetical protein
MSERIIFYLKRGAAILAALIFLQTLYFKFSAHPDSVYIFTKIGGEPYLPKGSGIAELGIGLLLLYPKTSHYGALPGLLLMLGAIGQYQFVPGINVNNHGGTLFALALITLISCVIVLVLKRKNWGHL